MANAKLIQADTEFQRANFGKAGRLYLEVLANPNFGKRDPNELAGVLRKLGDCHYIARRFGQAQKLYERLLTVQFKGNLLKKDQIFTLLKLASTYDQSNKKKWAEESFQAAYDLANSCLPSRHFLRRDVISSYADWLESDVRNVPKLTRLRNELVAIGNNRRTESLSVLVSITGQDAHELSLARKLMTAIEHGALERTLSMPEDGPDEEEALETFDEKTAEVQHDLTWLRRKRRFTKQENFYFPGSLAKHLDSRVIVRKFVFKEPVAKEPAIVDKVLEYVGLDTGAQGPARLREPLKEKRMWRDFWRPLIITIPTVLALTQILIFYWRFGAPNENAVPKFASKVLYHWYEALDGSTSIYLGANEAKLKGKNTRTAKVYFWRGSRKDQLRLLKGEFDNCRWLTPVEAGVKDDNGTIFYDRDAPELKVVAVMAQAAERVQNFYAANGRYIVPGDIHPNSYINPVSKKSEDLPVLVEVNNLGAIKDEEDSRFNDLEGGQLFPLELSGHAGSISSFTIRKRPPVKSLRPIQSVKPTEVFYLHGFDRHGELIPSSSGKKAMVTRLLNGLTKTSGQDDPFDYSSCDICLTETTPTNPLLLWMGILFVAGIACAIFGFYFWTRHQYFK